MNSMVLWNVEVTSTVYNNELEAYTASNVQVANGTLILTAQRQSSAGKSYTSGRINTGKKHTFTSGKFEASIKMPLGQGFWPAFWLYPYVDTSSYTEIDIMEAIGQLPGQMTGTCYPGGDPNNPPMYDGTYKFSSGQNFYSAYHTYGVEWTAGNVAFYVDGTYYFTCKKSTTPTSWTLESNPMMIIFNLAVGGDDPGSPSASTPFPSKMFVDWVRVYQDDGTTTTTNTTPTTTPTTTTTTPTTTTTNTTPTTTTSPNATTTPSTTPTTTAPTTTTGSTGQLYNLVWSDEFNGNALNTSNWNVEVTSTVYNNELEAYTANNVQVANGTLILTAQKQSSGGKSYTSGRINTGNKHTFTSGKFEASIMMPFGQGFWPAFWLYPYVDTSSYTEIDIMEAIGQLPGQMTGTCYPGGDPNAPPMYQGTYTFPKGQNFSSTYHTYGVEWTPGNLVFYVDGNYYFTVKKTSTPTSWTLESNPMMIIFNLAVGGDDPGSPSASTQFPSKMFVDWVRVYQPTAAVLATTNEVSKPAMSSLAASGATSCSSYKSSSLKNGIKYLETIGKVSLNTIRKTVLASTAACCNLCGTTPNCVALKSISSSELSSCTLYSTK